jgi:tripartite-type tricarboxylate transporter receptor subunit TctC
MKLRIGTIAPVLLAALLSPFAAFAQAYPSKIVHVVIPWPGGSNDAVGRIVFQKIAESMGQPVVIENRPGAASTIGAAYVARSAPDGYTVMVTSATHVANAHLYAKLPYDTLKDFIGVTPLSAQVGVLAVHPSLPVKSVRDLIALAKARPDQILYGSSGGGSFLHLTMVQLNAMTGARMVHVPYKGGDAAGVSLVAGETQAMIATMPVVKPLLAGNRVRVLAVTSDTRVKQLPDVPTLAEAGVPGYELTAWVGAFVPVGTSRAIVDRLNAEIKKALGHPDVAARFDSLALEPMYMTPEQFALRLKSDYDKYAKLIALIGAKVD